jgi:hypothetical protein
MEPQANYSNAIFWIEVEKIQPNPFQPRKEFDEAALQSLSESVRQYGILQPLVVTRKETVRPGWWLILFFIPIVNLIIHLIVALNLAKSFKRSTAFGIFFLWLLPIIGFLVLGFGKSKYVGPSVKK